MKEDGGDKGIRELLKRLMESIWLGKREKKRFLSQ